MGVQLLRRRLNLTGLFNRRRHFGNRHQRTGYLVKQLIGVLLFRERLRKKRYHTAVAKLLCKIASGRVPRYLIVLDPLGGPNQGEIGGSVVFLYPLLYHLLAFLDDTLHAFAGFRARRLAKQFKTFVQTLDLGFRLGEMDLEQFA